MKWFYDMKIGRKLILAFVAVGVITAVVGLVGVLNIGKIADQGAAAYEKETLGIVYLKQANVEMIDMARAEKNLLLSSTPGEREKYRVALTQFSGAGGRKPGEGPAPDPHRRGKGAADEVRFRLDGSERRRRSDPGIGRKGSAGAEAGQRGVVVW